MPDPRIRHVFVLMLENRSFDHMLGFSGIPGIDGLAGSESNVDAATGRVVRVSPDAPLALPTDPPHEYQNVMRQLCGAGGSYAKGVTLSGFVDSYRDALAKAAHPYDPADIMRCQPPAQVPALVTLAREFAVCDRWFSSLPGPTWPNRFFVHAATSGGLFRSPSAAETVSSELVGPGFTFRNGTIFDRLTSARQWWRVYHGDHLPQVQAINGMLSKRMFTDHFEDFAEFAADVAKADYPFAYTFIEPNYGHDSSVNVAIDFARGDSDHPVGSVAGGESLIKKVYEAIRSSPIWASSLLIITYDEHGGFYDHVAPPAAVPPGDGQRNAKHNPPEDPALGGEVGTGDFAFDRYGVRVPAVIVSPYIARGTVAHEVFDHSSIVATVLRDHGLAPLTERDRQANDVRSLLTLTQPRTDAPASLPDPVYAVSATPTAPTPTPSDAALDPVTASFTHLAAQADLQLSAIPERLHLVERLQNVSTKASALGYIAEVKAKMAYHDLLTQKKGLGSLLKPLWSGG
jgi:phospholipase C